MSQLSIKYFSQALNQEYPVLYIQTTSRKTPKKMRTLFLLHGYTGDAGNWVPEWLAHKTASR